MSLAKINIHIVSRKTTASVLFRIEQCNIVVIIIIFIFNFTYFWSSSG